MKKIALGMTGCLLILVFIYSFFCAEDFIATTMKQAPDWIQGTLILNTCGIKRITADEPLDQYLCEFDFGAESILTTKVPTNTALFQDKGTGESVIVYPASNSYAWWDPENQSGHHPMKWRSYYYDRIIHSSNEECLQTEYEGRITGSYAPLAVLGLSSKQSSTESVTYLMQYGISDDGNLEIQLGSVSKDTVDKGTVFNLYASLDLDENLALFNYDISKDGKIAWTRRVDEIYVSNGKDTIKLQDDEACSSALCWIDNETLLYVANTTTEHVQMGEPYNYTLRLWHIGSNSIEDAVVLNGDEFGLIGPPNIMVYDAINQCLALYCANTLNRCDTIWIYSLKTGEYFNFVPWQQDYYNASGVLIGSQGLSEDGTLYFEPLDMMEPQMLWYAT